MSGHETGNLIPFEPERELLPMAENEQPEATVAFLGAQRPIRERDGRPYLDLPPRSITGRRITGPLFREDAKVPDNDNQTRLVITVNDQGKAFIEHAQGDYQSIARLLVKEAGQTAQPRSLFPRLKREAEPSPEAPRKKLDLWKKSKVMAGVGVLVLAVETAYSVGYSFSSGNQDWLGNMNLHKSVIEKVVE